MTTAQWSRTQWWGLKEYSGPRLSKWTILSTRKDYWPEGRTSMRASKPIVIVMPSRVRLESTLNRLRRKFYPMIQQPFLGRVEPTRLHDLSSIMWAQSNQLCSHKLLRETKACRTSSLLKSQTVSTVRGMQRWIACRSKTWTVSEHISHKMQALSTRVRAS